MESPNPSDIKEVVVSLEQTLEHANESSSKICGDSILTTSETNALEESNVTERFAIFWHEECSLHEIKGHPEQPDRVSCILVALKKIYSEDCFRKAPIVTADQILLFHAESHLRNLISLCDNSERGFDENDDDEMYQSIDGDTVVMWKTRRAVWRAAGSVISAVDDLYLETGNPCRIRYLLRNIAAAVFLISIESGIRFALIKRRPSSAGILSVRDSLKTGPLH